MSKDFEQYFEAPDSFSNSFLSRDRTLSTSESYFPVSYHSISTVRSLHSDYDYPFQHDSDYHNMNLNDFSNEPSNVELVARSCHPWNVPFDNRLLKFKNEKGTAYSNEILVYKVILIVF